MATDRIMSFLDDISNKYPGAEEQVEALRDAIEGETPAEDDEEVPAEDDSEFPMADDAAAPADEPEFPAFPMRKK